MTDEKRRWCPQAPPRFCRQRVNARACHADARPPWHRHPLPPVRPGGPPGGHATAIILANLQGPKLTNIFGLETSLGAIFDSSIFFATDVLSENYGRREAAKAVHSGRAEPTSACYTARMQPSGVITITTDFGHKGPFAAVMKGVILSRFPDARVIDLAHDIPAQWPPEAGFWVRYSYRYFPAGTVHVAIVDPGIGSEREILLVEYDGHTFIAPDNGLLGNLLDDAPDPGVAHLDFSCLAKLGLDPPGTSFQGRDIFAPVAAEIAAGRLTAADVGRPTTEWTPGWLDNPEVGAGRVSGTIVTLDAFGNLISNIESSLVAGFENAVAHIGGHDLPLLPSYAHARPGDFLALINSLGVVEIAKAEGNAAESLGLERGAPLTIRARAD